MLFVDAYNYGVQFYVENALNVLLNGATVNDRLPDPTSWDRYDYLDAASSWCAPMFRNTDGTSGGLVTHFLGYKFIAVNTGTFPTGTMRDRDWQGFGQWMNAVDCVGNPQPRQGFWASGDNIATIIQSVQPSFLANFCGAFLDCNSNWDLNCPSTEDPTRNDTLYCTKLRPSPGCAFVPSFDLDVYGNWCPAKYSFDVVGVGGTGCGNKSYQRWSDNYYAPNRYAQVANDASGGASNYRTVLDGYSIHHAIRADAGPGPPARVPSGHGADCTDVLGRVPEHPALDAQPGGPFNFERSLCRPVSERHPSLLGRPDDGKRMGQPALPKLSESVQSSHHDPILARGQERGAARDLRRQRAARPHAGAGTLAGGAHEVVWDGTDDAGHPVAAGVFWSQLKAGEYTSNKKMVVLK